MLPGLEVVHQREAYSRLVERLPRTPVVDAARPLTDMSFGYYSNRSPRANR